VGIVALDSRRNQAQKVVARHAMGDAQGSESGSLLLVEDDSELAALMVRFLSRHGFHVDVVSDGREGLTRALAHQNDLVILDVMLPHLAGMEILRCLRRRSRIPIIIVTARGAHEDRVAGLKAGADDYLSKPFEPDELLARIEAVLRRSGAFRSGGRDIVEVGDIRMDIESREVEHLGQKVELTSIEFDILEVLMRSAGRVVSRDEVSSILHQRETTPYERSLDVHISHLRRKLDCTGDTLIRAVRGVGYMFRASSSQA
jgi:two-component system response regulator CpxR